MTYKAVVYSDHAILRMAEQRITRRNVRFLLTRGGRQPEQAKPGGDSRWSCRGLLGVRQGIVVFVEDAHRIEVITAYFLD